MKKRANKSRESPSNSPTLRKENRKRKSRRRRFRTGPNQNRETRFHPDVASSHWTVAQRCPVSRAFPAPHFPKRPSGASRPGAGPRGHFGETNIRGPRKLSEEPTRPPAVASISSRPPQRPSQITPSLPPLSSPRLLYLPLLSLPPLISLSHF